MVRIIFFLGLHFSYFDLYGQCKHTWKWKYAWKILSRFLVYKIQPVERGDIKRWSISDEKCARKKNYKIVFYQKYIFVLNIFKQNQINEHVHSYLKTHCIS